VWLQVSGKGLGTSDFPHRLPSQKRCAASCGPRPTRTRTPLLLSNRSCQPRLGAVRASSAPVWILGDGLVLPVLLRRRLRGMSSPAQRQFDLLQAIRRGECPSYSWIMRRFGVSKDTAKRDKDALRSMGAQLQFDPARGGFRLLNPEWRWTGEELSLLAGEAGGVAGTAARALLEAWNPALSAQLSSEDRSKLDAALVFTTSRHCPTEVDHLCLLVRAIADGRVVQFRYHSPWDAPKEDDVVRHVSPWLLQVDDGHTYLRGYCHLRSDLRAFHLSSLRDLAATDQPARPRPTDLRPLVRSRMGIGGELGETQTAVVRLRGGWARWVAGEVWHADQQDRWYGEELERRFPFGMVPETVRRLLPGGADVEVVGPVALRLAWEQVVAGMAKK